MMMASRNFSHTHQMCILMPMEANRIQTPSGEQREHLENVICDDFEVWGGMEA